MKKIVTICFYGVFILFAVVFSSGCYPDSYKEASSDVDIDIDIKIESTNRSSASAWVHCAAEGDINNIKQVGVCWGKSSRYEYRLPDITKDSVVVGKVDSEGRFSIKIKGLIGWGGKPSEYCIRAFAKFNDGKVMYSDTLTVKTLEHDDMAADKAHLVTVNDVVVGDFTQSSVPLSAGVRIAEGVKVLERGFCWQAIKNDAFIPDLGDQTIIIDQSGLNTTLSAVLELKYTTTYFVRAYVWTEYGVKYSTNTTEYKFDNSIIMPQVTQRMVVSDKTVKSATFSAVVDMSSRYGVTRRGFCWINSYYTDPTVSDNVIECDINSTSEFSAKASDLKAETLYRVRAFATNSAGTSYSDVSGFSTLQYSTLPVLESASSFRV